MVDGLPAGTVTFFFSDVAQSTEMWSHDEEAMEGALQRHDELMRAAISSAGGVVFSTAGDSFHAVFERASDAAQAAVDAQRQLGAERWRTAVPLRVRIGLHTGEAHERDGDYFGSAVNRAARVAGVAHAGQILCSQATERVLTDHRLIGVELRPLGSVRLKGLDGVEQVFQVVAEGVRAEFPPLARVSGLRGTPAADEPLIGREHDLRAICELIARRGLITLSGTGGVGKTSLARAAALRSLDLFADGAWWIDLTASPVGGDVGPLLAHALNIGGAGASGDLNTIAQALWNQHLLVVLDNCEHVLDSAAAVAARLLAECPNLTVLATSRRRLAISGEHVVHVEPLGVDGWDSAAVELITTRIADRGTVVDPSERAAIEELARRLDGLPLALELAASRCAVMPPSAVLARLADRFRLFERGTARSLSEVVRWSFDLLGPASRTVARRLCVFAESFSLDAAETVASDHIISTFDVDDALIELVEGGLIDFNGRRYSMLETTRAFLDLDLDRAGERATLRRRHASWAISVLQKAHMGLRGPDELRWVDVLDDEWPNLRTASATLLELDDPELPTTFATLLTPEGWFRRPEALTWIVAIHERFGHADNPRRHDLMGAAGEALWVLDNPDGAVELGRRAVELRPPSAAPGDYLPESALLIGSIYSMDARAALEPCKRQQQSSDPFRSIMGLCGEALAHVMSQQYEEGERIATIAVQEAERLRNPSMRCFAAHHQALSISDPRARMSHALETRRLAIHARNTYVQLISRSLWAASAASTDASDEETLTALLQSAHDLVRAGWITVAWDPVARFAVALGRSGHTVTALWLARCVMASPGAYTAGYLERSIKQWMHANGDDQ